MTREDLTGTLASVLCAGAAAALVAAMGRRLADLGE